ATVTGTGVGGRIRKEDILNATPTPTATSGAAPRAASPVESPLRGQTIKMTTPRKTAAERMVESLPGMAQLTTAMGVDPSRVWALRSKSKSAFEAKHGVKLTFLPFFTKAVAEALQEHAFLNASVAEDAIVYHPAVHMGIAVDTERGLMVPVIKDSDSKTLVQH